MSIVESRGDHVFYERFLKVAEAWGLPQARDYNSGPQEGAHLTQANIRNGVRCSAAEAYLKPAMERANLSVRTGAFVRSIRVAGGRAVAAHCVIAGEACEIRAEREVILCAGTIASPPNSSAPRASRSATRS